MQKSFSGGPNDYRAVAVMSIIDDIMKTSSSRLQEPAHIFYDPTAVCIPAAQQSGRIPSLTDTQSPLSSSHIKLTLLDM